MSRDEPWLFPELDRSFKQIFILQMLPVSCLVGVIGYQFGALWCTIAGSLVGLAWCLIIASGVRNARTRSFSERAQEAMAAQRGSFGAIEGRLLDRAEMRPPPPPARTTQALEGPEAYGE